MIALVTAALMTASPAAVPPVGEPCKDSLDIAIFTTPRHANKQAPLRIMIVSDEPLPGSRIAALGPDGETRVLEAEAFGGPPYGWVARVDSPARGSWRVAISTGDTVHACQKVRVAAHGAAAPVLQQGVDPIWRSRIKWERDTENLYSLWIEYLFETPPDEQPTWRPLHEALRNNERNLLFNHLNLGEDGPREETALQLKPDCADFPYHLRAYFAWKLGLPFAFRGCGRGTTTRPPRCGNPSSNQMSAERRLVVRAFQHFARRTVGGRVHSSSPRTLPADEKSDFYPVAMTRRGIRPGTIFADPYGHILVVAKWYPQQEGRPGILFAVDAQPDKTVGRRRFWRGSFLFPEDGAVTGAGFKRFRPVRMRRDGSTGVMSNAEIAASVDYGDYSVEQWEMGKALFYERMDALISPKPMSPATAFSAALDALTEQVERRVLSVDAGEQWKTEHPGRRYQMPEGAKIFQTAGPWEDYSTPSRDLRLLIAIQSVVDYPRRVVRFRDRFVLPAGMTPETAQQALTQRLMSEAAQRKFTYTRSDGTPWELSVADVIERRVGMEMAYNPNDCPEIRWAAPDGSEEAKTCRDHAPAAQRQRMSRYRQWFSERRRPVR